MIKPDPQESAQDFWERLYKKASPKTSGRPSATLVRFAEGRPPGRALDLGCAKGDDAVWLAKHEWHVTAVDISPTVLDYAQQNATRAGIAENVHFERHDLAESFPSGSFDLVTALFLQTPMAFPRARVLSQAAHQIASGGLLLAVTHGSVAPWSWSDPDTIFPTAEESLDELKLNPSEWSQLFVGEAMRQATGPGGQVATVTDIIIAIERR